MESQMIRPQDYAHEQNPYQAQDPHSVEGGEEHRGKKSVLKKVKAKAKKIKDTMIPKHGNGQNQDHDDDDHDHDRNTPDDHDLDEEDDEEYEESSEGPEVQGAPIYESEKAVTSAKADEDKIPLSSLSDHDHHHGISDSPKESVDTSKTFVPGTESTKVNLGRPRGLEEDPHAPGSNNDQNPSNYQTKVNDPSGTGADEVGINPILRSFDRLNIDENSGQLPKSNQSVESPIGTGSHDQFSPEQNLGNTTTPASTPTSGYVSTATSALANSALSAKNMVASKLGYGEKDNTTPETTTAGAGESKPATSAIADKAISTKDTVASKLGYGEKDNTAPESLTTATTGESKPATSAIANRAISAKDLVASKLGYGEKDNTAPESATSAVGGETKPATSAITERAISAKNMIASKLGYGEKDNTTPESPTNTTTAVTGENKPATATATEYGKKIASTVYGTVAGAGTAVMSKMPGGGGAAPESQSPATEAAAKAGDKGVSVKEYLAEKLRPGEDDTALSEAITDAIHKRQPETTAAEEEQPPRAAVGKVTESEEVARRLGNDGESETRIDQGKGSGYVEKVKGSVGSWLGYGDQSSKGSPKPPGEKVDDGLQGKEELKLQESGNY